MKISVGEAIVRYLDNQYVSFDGAEYKFVEGVFAVFGHGCVLGVGEALANGKHSLKVYQGKNEQGMAHAATAYAKQSNRRKIMPCISSIGPGAANMVTAAATATVNNIPLLLFPGDTFATRRPDPVLQQFEQPHDLTITTNDAFKPVTRVFDRIYRPEMLYPALENAMRVLTDPELAGAVCIALPQDVQGEVWDFPEYMFEKRVRAIDRREPSEDELIRAAAVIEKAKYPLIIVGGGARYSEAGRAIEEFLSETNIPFAETQAGKSTIPCSSPYYLGGLGVTGNSAANTVAANADVIIGLGTRFSDFTTSSKTLFKNAKAFVNINVSRYHALKMRGVTVVGDVKKTIEKLTAKLQGYRSAYAGEFAAARKEWVREADRLFSSAYSKDMIPEIKAMTPGTIEDFNAASGAALTQTRAIGIIRKNIPMDAVVVAAAGSLPGCMQRLWDTDSLYSYNMEYGYSCMGYEIAGALGSKLAEPGREVYAMVGDGSYLMLHSEMVTAVQEGVKINVMLFDNGGFGCINNLQMGKGVNSLATELRYRAEADTPFVPIDFAMSARAYGLKAFTARTPEELEAALEAAKKETGSVLIDIKVLPKTMTDGCVYGWWQTGVTHDPGNETQRAALDELEENIEKFK